MLTYVKMLEVLYRDIPKNILGSLFQKFDKQEQQSRKLNKSIKGVNPESSDEFWNGPWIDMLNRYDDSTAQEYKIRQEIETKAVAYREEQIALAERREEKEARKLYAKLKERFDPPG